MNAKSASAAPAIPVFDSPTPNRAPSSAKLSPPPLKQHRLPRHVAVPISDTVDTVDTAIEMEGVSSLLSIMHGHNLMTTPRDSSYPSNFFVPSLDENAEDSMADQRLVDDRMEEEIADFEVAMIASISRDRAAIRPFDQRAAMAASRVALESRSRRSSPSALPFIPRDDDLIATPEHRERFALLPKINLYKEKY